MNQALSRVYQELSSFSALAYAVGWSVCINSCSIAETGYYGTGNAPVGKLVLPLVKSQLALLS